MRNLLSNFFLKVQGQRDIVLNVHYSHGAIEGRDKVVRI